MKQLLKIREPIKAMKNVEILWLEDEKGRTYFFDGKNFYRAIRLKGGRGTEVNPQADLQS